MESSDAYPLVVLGAGPAGATFAAHAGALGLPVLLLDAHTFPRDKICGDALSGNTTYELEKLPKSPVPDFLERVPATPSGGIRFVAPGGKVLDLKLKRTRDGFPSSGLVARRMDFDAFLWQQATAWPTVEFVQCKVQQIEALPQAWNIQTNLGNIKAEVVVAADGAQSRFVRELQKGETIHRKHHSAGLRMYMENVQGFSSDGLIELHFRKDLLPGYFWMFPMPGNRANIGLGVRSDVVARNQMKLRPKLLEIVRENSLLGERFSEASALEQPQGFGLPLGSTRRKAGGNGYVVLGDAAGLIDPFSGEGIGPAMASGRLAALHLHEAWNGKTWMHRDFDSFTNRLWKHVGDEFRISYLLQRLLRFPVLFDAVVARCNRSPKWHQSLEMMLDRPEERKQMARPGFWLSLLRG